VSQWDLRERVPVIGFGRSSTTTGTCVRAAARIAYTTDPTYVHVRVPTSCRSITRTSIRLRMLSGGASTVAPYSE
jgi:hypothetical protein